MTKPRLIEICGLNIAMHAPHSSERYIKLLKDAFNLRLPLRISNVHMLMLGSIYPLNANDTDEGVTGEIYRFVRLDPNEPWFNAETHEAATANDLREVNIPRHLLPHLQRFQFVFQARQHRLYYVRKDRKDSMGPKYVKLLLEHLIRALVDADKYPVTNVTIIPDEKSLEKIFGMHSIERLVIEINRPNPDDGDTDQERWEEKLRRQGVKKMVVQLSASRGEHIEADDETRTMAEVGALNGKVLAIGKDAYGVKSEESTIKKSLVEYVPINTEIETVSDVLTRTALAINQRIG